MPDSIINKKIHSDAVVLLSGGMDSTTLLYFAKKVHDHVYALIINYNQRHKKEIDHAIEIAKKTNTPYFVLNLEMPKYSGSPLVDSNIMIPDQDEKKQKLTVVPLRNTYFLLHSCGFAIQKQADDIYIGAVQDDYNAYLDCRPEYFKSFQNMLEIQNIHLNIRFPFVKMKKEKIISLGEQLNVPWHLTWTCYQGNDKACGKCDACKERLNAFKFNKIQDPIEYA